MRSGRPAMAALKRSRTRSSSGRTLYFTASSMKSALRASTFSGYLAARSFVRLKSSSVLYSSQVSFSNVARGAASQNALCRVVAYQPSW